MPKPPWSEDEVRALLAKHRFAYQNVPLPYGLETGGDDRSPTAHKILPPDLAGKSLLDLGCRYGYFCFEAERRGAAPVVGADIDPGNIRKARLLAACKGSDAEFLQLDIEDAEIGRQYDYVLCLNVLHHLRNPLAALDKLIAATREVLVLEVASFSIGDRSKNGVGFIVASLLKRLPILYLGRRHPKWDSDQMFYITKPALETMLLRHRRIFAGVEFFDTGHKGRLIAVARKRRIDHLFVIAGIPTDAKRGLIHQLLTNRQPKLAAALGFEPSETWIDPREWDGAEVRSSGVHNVIMDYNLLKAKVGADLQLHDRSLLDLMNIARRVTLVTAWQPRAELMQRSIRGRFGAAIEKTTGSHRRNRKVHELLDDAELYSDVFRAWMEFCRRHGSAKIVVRQGRSYKLTTIEELERSDREFRDRGYR